MNRLDKKQIFIGTILGIILSILTLILLTRNIQPLSAQQTTQKYTTFKTDNQGFKFLQRKLIITGAYYEGENTKTNYGSARTSDIGRRYYLYEMTGEVDTDRYPRLSCDTNNSTVDCPNRFFESTRHFTSPPQYAGDTYRITSGRTIIIKQKVYTFREPVIVKPIYREEITYAPIFAQTPTTNSPANQVVTKEYVLNVVGGSDCPIFTRLNVQGVEKFVCLLGKIVEPVWNAYYGPITDVRYERIHEERKVVEVKNDHFFKNVLNKPIIGVRAWIDDKYDNTNGVCAILIPNKLAIVLTNGNTIQYGYSIVVGGTIFKPLDVKEFGNQYSVRNCGEWNHIAYGRFWTAYVVSGDRSSYKSEYETPIILFHRFGSAGNYVIEGTSNTLSESTCYPGGYLIRSAMSKGFNGDRFYLTENDKIIFDFTAVRRKSNVQFQCAIKFYYIP